MNELDKKQKTIAGMFNSISNSYDFLNHSLSFGMDYYWRRYCIKQLKKYNAKHIIDIAAGTGDFTFAAQKLKPELTIGIDISEKMLEVAKQKLKKKKLHNKIDFIHADALNIPFNNDYFNMCTVGFGIRNFENLNKGIAEIYRILKNNGIIAILEFSIPENKLFRSFYFFYFKNLLPLWGKLISKNKIAYNYLHDSVIQFSQNIDVKKVLKNNSFTEIKTKQLTGGIVTCYIFKKQ